MSEHPSIENSTLNDSIPTHIAIIMDGNGRWANQRKRPRAFGHAAGVSAVKRVIKACIQEKIQYLTLFAFSSENWKRPQTEVSRLMTLFMSALNREVNEMHENGVCLRFIGDLSRFSTSLQKKMRKTEEKMLDNQRLIVSIAVNYGGYWDICQASKIAAQRVLSGEMAVDDITPEFLDGLMALRPVPSPDLLIRSGGEQRISNFLLWDTAYTEFYFTDTLWPDFGTEPLAEALQNYAQRQRRFGLTGGQVKGQENHKNNA